MSTTVLLVDDDEGVRTSLRRGLEIRGYHVIEAMSGEETLWWLEYARVFPDVAVIDVKLPGIHGGELAAQLLARVPNLPVLFVTAGSTKELTEDGMLPPGAPILLKPFTADELAARVGELLR